MCEFVTDDEREKTPVNSKRFKNIFLNNHTFRGIELSKLLLNKRFIEILITDTMEKSFNSTYDTRESSWNGKT